MSDEPPFNEGRPLDPKPPTPSSDWLSVDVGEVIVPGATAPDDEQTFVVRSAGRDVWDQEDSFHFSYQAVTGDTTITVRVDDIQAVHEWSKVGIMIREDLNPGSRNAFLHITQDNGTVLQARYQTANNTVDWRDDFSLMHYSPARTPWWLKLERQGNTITGWHSEDGQQWTQLEQLQLELPEDVLVGLAVSSHSPGESASGVFFDPQVSGLVTTDPDPEPSPEPEPEPSPEPSPDPIPEPQPGPTPPPQPGPTTTVTYTTDNSNFPNPERGWYSGNANHSNGHTLTMRYIRLDNYRYQALPNDFLNNLRNDLQALRNRGTKLIIRFSYNHGITDDAPLNNVLQHINQITPILHEYSDVIAVMQAGFIGAWGEWHNSTNNLATPENRRTISNALLQALPETRMIQIRTPYLRSDIYDQPTPTTAFNNTPNTRTGHHNDCFLSSSNDSGTYRNQQDRDYIHHLTQYTAMGGETCQVGQLDQRNDCLNALNELALYHWDYLHHDFYIPIIDKWRNQGCYDEISRRLGYRYTMTETTSATTVQTGQTLALTTTINNQGWGKLYNPRPLQLILQPTNGGTPITLTTHQDARHILPLAGQTTTIPIQIQIPTNTPTGTYQLHLNLPDPSPNLNTDPRYSIRLANQNTWNPTTGHNNLNITINITNP